MHLPHSYNRLILAGALFALVGATLPGRTDPTQAGLTGQNGSAPAPVSSKLQVSGTTQKFSIEADHADVQSALKLLFDQAKRQFTLDSSVTGQLTLRLTEQPFEVVLDTICKQTFLRYRHEVGTDITTFSQDTDAIRDAFTHLRSLNAEMRQQLRELGLEVPGDNLLSTDPQGQGATGRLKTVPAPGNAAGGFGGGARAAGPAGPAGGDKGDKGENGNVSGRARIQEIPTNGLTPNDLANAFGLSGQSPQNDSSQDLYRQFLRQNNLVTINTQGREVAVTDVFQELQRQSNVAILVDPDVPRGPKFRMQLTLRPTTLTDAMNLLCPALHLNWRQINNALFITPVSDFQIFWGSSTQPRVIYGQPPSLQQRGAIPNTQQGVNGPTGTNGAGRRGPN